jgi:hypothetical protein
MILLGRCVGLPQQAGGIPTSPWWVHVWKKNLLRALRILAQRNCEIISLYQGAEKIHLLLLNAVIEFGRFLYHEAAPFREKPVNVIYIAPGIEPEERARRRWSE